MCGFAAILSSSGESRYEEICKMSSSISHRGPDDEGYCLINDINNANQQLINISLFAC